MTATLALLITGMVTTGAWLGWFAAPTFACEIVLFFSLSNVGLYWLCTRGRGREATDFVKIYLGATVLRILFFGGFIFTVILMDRPEAPKNELFFLVSYFLFTIQEVGALFLKIDSEKALKRGQKDP
jgi:cytochrome bd-type quinol oxidase subunit 2